MLASGQASLVTVGIEKWAVNSLHGLRGAHAGADLASRCEELGLRTPGFF